MGLFSKLFGSTPPTEAPAATDAVKHPPIEPEEILTPQVMNPYVPEAARPTNPGVPDVHERETVVAPEPAPAVASPHAPLAKTQSRPPPPAVAKRSEPPKRSKPPPLPPAALRKSERPSSPETLEGDPTERREQFAKMATSHMRPIRDFMIELRSGPAPTTWIGVCQAPVHSLRRAADGLEYSALASALNDLAKALLAQELVFATTIDGAARERILVAHAELATLLPETFALDGDRSAREAAILDALLAQIPGVGKVTIDKLHAAGLTTLDTMLLATAEDLASTSGIAPALVAVIIERFRVYREEIAGAAVDETRAHERGKIAPLVERLRTENEEIARAADAWKDEAVQRKKDLVVARLQTMAAIDLQLARLGEIVLVQELARLSFARKLELLESFLARAHY